MSISRRAIGQVACDLAIGRGRIPAKSFQVFRRMLVHPPPEKSAGRRHVSWLRESAKAVYRELASRYTGIATIGVNLLLRRRSRS
jgi:hypothetical protein